MKKVLFALAISAFFVACNSSSTETESTMDSTAVAADTSSMMAPPVADTTMADTSHMMSADTSVKK